MFRVGQKVVCINDVDGDAKSPYGMGYANGLRKGEIYTVIAIRSSDCIDVDRITRGGWFADRFRPVVDRKTDISIFTEMLNKQPVLLEL